MTTVPNQSTFLPYDPEKRKQAILDGRENLSKSDSPEQIIQQRQQQTEQSQQQATAAAGSEAPAASTTSGTNSMSAYNPANDAAYQQALATLTAAKQNMPTYTSSYDQQIQDAYAAIINRQPFSYDINSDALYQQMKDQYIQQGQMAMMDTMGQAAALTGGYGSSYGQAVGQQAYNNYLQELNNNIPEYYDRAYRQWANEGDALMQAYQLTGDMADREYQRYNDSYNKWLTEYGLAADAENQAYSRGLADWQLNYNIEQDQYNRQYQEQKDAYSRIMTMMSSYGYSPSDEELAAAGINRDQANKVLAAYKAAHAKKSSGSSSGSGNKNNNQQTVTVNQWVKEAMDVYSSGGATYGEITTALGNTGFNQQEKAQAKELIRLSLQDLAYEGVI